MAEGGWVEGERGERTPFEASLLSSLDHPGRIFLMFRSPWKDYVNITLVRFLTGLENPDFLKLDHLCRIFSRLDHSGRIFSSLDHPGRIFLKFKSPR